ncbi:MAG: xanthine dehydrogenase family protein molybdopterin-binding subunit [Candidatus Rokubacteria bacterium]|nr:xanthine dehydrogenase family protein molybdopterin-binding subunit [Candidatus Rokubacteria bacterium]
MPHVGARLKRLDDPRILTGRGHYVDDVTLPRMVHVAFVRSVHAHARLTRVDVEAARGAPEVAGVLTGAEAARLCKPYRGILLHYKGMKTGAMLPLALDRVRYVGEPIVAVAATSRAAAEDAAQLVAVEYEPLPAILDPEAAVAPGAALIHPELPYTSVTGNPVNDALAPFGVMLPEQPLTPERVLRAVGRAQ